MLSFKKETLVKLNQEAAQVVIAGQNQAKESSWGGCAQALRSSWGGCK